MEPILKGTIRFPEDGRTIWEGRWGMSLSAFEDPNLEQLNVFRYISSSRVNFSVGDVVSFKGYFEVSSINKGSKSQFTDKVLEMEVVSEDSDSGMRTVRGNGNNRFGNFDIKGTFNPASNILEVRRIYVPKPITTKVPKNQASAVIPSISAPNIEHQPSDSNNEALSSIPNDLDVKSKVNSQPQSPSSPADVHTVPVKLPTSILQTEPPKTPAIVEKSQRQIPVDTSFYREAKQVLNDLKAKDINRWFSEPVDAEALGLRDYHSVVKTPMDLGTIETKLGETRYSSWEECLSDMRLTFYNALMYNPRSSLVYKAASDLNLFLDERVKLFAQGNVSQANLTSSIGKRAQKKKRFFEPGDLLDVTAAAASTAAVIAAVKKTPRATKSQTALQVMSATTQSAKKSKKLKVTTVKRSKQIAMPKVEDNSYPLIPSSALSSIPAESFDFPNPLNAVDDEEGVDSFDELDDKDVFMTPPPSDDEDDGQMVDETPLSVLPLLGDYHAFEAMSPTNLDDADDF